MGEHDEIDADTNVDNYIHCNSILIAMLATGTISHLKKMTSMHLKAILQYIWKSAYFSQFFLTMLKRYFTRFKKSSFFLGTFLIGK